MHTVLNMPERSDRHQLEKKKNNLKNGLLILISKIWGENGKLKSNGSESGMRERRNEPGGG